MKRRLRKRAIFSSSSSSSRISTPHDPIDPSISTDESEHIPASSPTSFQEINNNFFSSRGQQILYQSLKQKISSYKLDPLHAGLEEYSVMKRKMNMLKNSASLLEK